MYSPGLPGMLGVDAVVCNVTELGVTDAVGCVVLGSDNGCSVTVFPDVTVPVQVEAVGTKI